MASITIWALLVRRLWIGLAFVWNIICAVFSVRFIDPRLFAHNFDGDRFATRTLPSGTYAAHIAQNQPCRQMGIRTLAKEAGGWRNVRSSDWDLVTRWLEAGFSWVHTRRVTLNYTYRD
ncbi:MAG TPA: hypothetical protein VGH90_12250 [Chthoniobacteraceae bacterium]